MRRWGGARMACLERPLALASRQVENRHLPYGHRRVATSAPGAAAMPSPQSSPTTAFSRDLLGRFVCNGFDEAVASAQSRPHDCIVIGGGSFGSIFAQHLFASDREQRHRILVLEAGPFLLPEHVRNL